MNDIPDTPDTSGAAAPRPAPEDARRASLIEYPSRFPVKVVGENAPHFVHAITQVARAHDPAFDAATIELRQSKGGRYLGVTLTITATSREQLDALYHALSTHPMARWVL
jgi:putative lipoic acid-binding regulatory protein